MSQEHVDPTEALESNERESVEAIETRPTIKPTLVWLGITVVVGALLTGFVVTNPGVFGGAATADLVANALILLTVIGVIRFAVRAFVLTRTQYSVTRRSIVVSFSLLMRSESREVPLDKVRSHDYNQSRIQNLFGYGTVSLNEGLGDIELENVPEPERIHRQISELLLSD